MPSLSVVTVDCWVDWVEDVASCLLLFLGGSPIFVAVISRMYWSWMNTLSEQRWPNRLCIEISSSQSSGSTVQG